MMTRTIEAYCVDWEVSYTAYEGRAGTYWEPPEPAELCIEGISLGGCEIMELLLDVVVDNIYENLHNELCDDDF